MSSFTPHHFGKHDNTLGKGSYHRSHNSKSTGFAPRSDKATFHEAGSVSASPPLHPEFQDVWDSDEENVCVSLYSGKSISSGPFKSSWARSEVDAVSYHGSYSTNASVASVNSKWRKPPPPSFPGQFGRIFSYVQSSMISTIRFTQQFVPCLHSRFSKFERQNDVVSNSTSRFHVNVLHDYCSQAFRKYPAAVMMVSLVFILYVPVTITNLEAHNKAHLHRIKMDRVYNDPPDLPPIGGIHTQQRIDNMHSALKLQQKYYEHEKEDKQLVESTLKEKKIAMGPSSESINAFHGDKTRYHTSDSPQEISKGSLTSRNTNVEPPATRQTLLEEMFAADTGPDMEARHFAKLQGIDPRTLKISNSSRPVRSLTFLHDFPAEPASVGLPFYWHVPKAGGSTMKQIISVCYKLVTASEVGLLPALIPLSPPVEKGELKIMIDKGGVKYVNVDTTNPAGLRYARENGLAPSGLADVVSSHLFTGSLQLFTDEVKGKAFTIFRHPIERAVSMFYYLGSEQAKHEKTYDPALKMMTIEEFSKSNKIEDNWLTRSLNGGLVGKIGRKHTFFAKEVLRTKFLIGLLPQLDESMKRFENYFGWDNKSDDNNCVQELVNGGMNRNLGRKVVEDWSKEYISLLRHNTFDMELYHYAEELFEEQGRHFK